MVYKGDGDSRYPAVELPVQSVVIKKPDYFKKNHAEKITHSLFSFPYPSRLLV